MTDLEKEVCKAYGEDRLIDQLIEEMSELTKALLKDRRAEKYGEYDKCKTEKDVAEEVADVEICLKYLDILYSYKTPDFRLRVEDIKVEKYLRQKSRLEKQK